MCLAAAAAAAVSEPSRWGWCLAGAGRTAASCSTIASGLRPTPSCPSACLPPLVLLQQQKELKRRLVAAERKLLFFLAWANEQPAEVLEVLAMAATAEYQKHAAAVGDQPAAPAVGGLEARLATAGQSPAVQPQRGPTDALSGQGQGGAALIEEL